MAVFGVMTDDQESVRKFLRETEERFEGNNLVNNPFVAWLKFFKYRHCELITILIMRPLWPNFAPLIAAISLIPIIVFTSPYNTKWLFIPGFFLLLSFFWSEAFFFLMFKIGLRKAGYKGRVKRVKRTILIEELAARIL